MAYIEREAALEACEKEYQERLRMLDYCGDTVAWNIGGEIKSIPAADVAPVVRCRWCRFWDGEGRCEAPVNGLVREYTKESDFCSYGERRKVEL